MEYNQITDYDNIGHGKCHYNYINNLILRIHLTQKRSFPTATPFRTKGFVVTRPRHTSSSQEEAIEILGKIIIECTKNPSDLEVILRYGQHASRIMNWQQHYSWFYYELNGYPSTIPRPSYRMIKGKLVWQTDVAFGEAIDYESHSFVYGKSAEDSIEEDAYLDVYANINWLINSGRNGYYEKTEETRISNFGLRDKVLLRRVKTYTAQDFSTCLQAIKRIAFDFASNSYVILKYSDAIYSIWTDRRAKMEELLKPLGFNNHLNAIEKNLASENPESWRSAIFECRNLLEDLSGYL